MNVHGPMANGQETDARQGGIRRRLRLSFLGPGGPGMEAACADVVQSFWCLMDPAGLHQ